MTCRAIELLIEIRDQNDAILGHLKNLDVLENRRERDRLRKQSVRGQDFVRGQKEGEKGKEILSPTPPIREKGKGEEKAAAAAARARAREVFSPPTKEAVMSYAEKKKITESFVDYWFDCMATNYDPPWFDCVTQTYVKSWRRSLLTFWNNAEHDRGWLSWQRNNAPKTETPRTFTADDWILCAERCANFMAGECKCRVGCITPPPCKINPIPPEECAFFAKSEGYEP